MKTHRVCSFPRGSQSPDDLSPAHQKGTIKNDASEGCDNPLEALVFLCRAGSADDAALCLLIDFSGQQPLGKQTLVHLEHDLLLQPGEPVLILHAITLRQ